MEPIFVSINNKLERQRVKIAEADSGIDVALTKRYDTLTKLFDVAQGFVKHERQTILESIKLRKNMPLSEKIAAQSQLDQAAQHINALAESYPALTSQALFIELQKGVRDTEEHLQAARRLYNSNISIFNQLEVSFPSSIVAGFKSMKTMPMFEAEAEKRKDVSLKMES